MMLPFALLPPQSWFPASKRSRASYTQQLSIHPRLALAFPLRIRPGLIREIYIFNKKKLHRKCQLFCRTNCNQNTAGCGEAAGSHSLVLQLFTTTMVTSAHVCPSCVSTGASKFFLLPFCLVCLPDQSLKKLR